MRLGLRIAVRFLKSNKGQTLLIILGIAIGVSVQIFIGSLIQGLQKSLVEKTIGNSSQITISSDNDDARITDYKQLVDMVQASSSDIKTVSVVSNNPAFLEYNEKSQSLLLRGFEFDQTDGIYNIKDRINEGTIPQNENEIILGVDLRDEYEMVLNDEVIIITPDQKFVTCKIVGFFDLKVSNLNTGWGITTLETTQNIFETGDSVTSIEMQVKEDALFSADEIAVKIKASLNQENLNIVNWKEQNESLLSGLQGQSVSSYMIQIFVMISVVLAIASVLAITVLQKSKQIGILKAMGIRNSTTRNIFLFEGLILGLFGAILGILLGLGLSVAFTTFALNPDGTPVIALFISFPFIIFSGIIATLASVLAALIPAIRSSKLNPIDIIRNN
ncbi:MAG TPA: FtsX-like permease family protein [Mobilitalea sp.]|nr:FtsX-like permease family protein [Mobilitalea sp.]